MTEAVDILQFINKIKWFISFSDVLYVCHSLLTSYSSSSSLILRGRNNITQILQKQSEHFVHEDDVSSHVFPSSGYLWSNKQTRVFTGNFIACLELFTHISL